MSEGKRKSFLWVTDKSFAYFTWFKTKILDPRQPFLFNFRETKFQTAKYAWHNRTQC